MAMTQDERDQTHCYKGMCPECRRLIAVAVADPKDELQVRRALKNVTEWKRRGLLIGSCTVVDVRSGREPFWHTDECVTGKRAKARAERREKRETEAAR